MVKGDWTGTVKQFEVLMTAVFGWWILSGTYCPSIRHTMRVCLLRANVSWQTGRVPTLDATKYIDIIYVILFFVVSLAIEHMEGLVAQIGA